RHRGGCGQWVARRATRSWRLASRGLRLFLAWISDSIAVAFEQVGVGVDTAVAQKRPDPAHRFTAREIDLDNEQLRSIHRGLGQVLALRTHHETRSPELDAAT